MTATNKSPYKKPKHVLLTGATGYIGKRLIPALVEQQIRVTCLIRHQEMADEFSAMNCNVMVGDLATGDGLAQVPEDIDVAYFLVHAMSDVSQDLIDVETAIAVNFIKMLKKTSVRQIIYLSGLANHTNVSTHLQSRIAVENILIRSFIPTTILRSSIIIGSGSSSFEIIRDLVEKVPIMIAPKWINNQCQPISIYNVIELLIGVVHHPDCMNQIFDIGGPDVLTFKTMMLKLATFRGLRRWIISVPVLSLRLSSLWLFFVTSTNFSLSKYLVDSMKEDSLCKNNPITDIIPIKPFDFDTCLKRTFSKIEDHAVISSWKDSWHIAKRSKGLSDYIHVPTHGCFVERHTVLIDDIESVKDKCWAIGGANGWYFFNWAWRLRGFMDQCVGGVGLNRGRRHQTNIKAGDALDFWRVIYADKTEGRLLLYAEMKLPGNAWLEWQIKPTGDTQQLIQTATFRPQGIFGRLYWFALYPFHFMIFKGLAKSIARP